jgi:osmoprotectant transport system ATP-binding protein
MSDQRVITVEFSSVTYEIDGVKILNGLELEIGTGEIVVILGESGCGKTTTLRLINRLIDPTSGKVLVMGKPTAEWDPVELRRSVGYVMQDGGLFPHMTVRQNAGIVLALQGAEANRVNARSNEMLKLVRLDPDRYGNRFPHELSGGQRQRVGVARALASDPDLLLLDEPFGALDAITRAGLQREFAALVSDLGKTAVFVTHDLQEALLLGTRIILMDKGHILFADTPSAFRKSDIPMARAYLETVLLPA